MGAKTRQLAIAVVAVVLVLVGTVAWTAAHSDSPAEQQTIGLDEVKLACHDVRQASDFVDGPYPGMAAGLLDIAIKLTVHASQLSPDWTQLDAAVQDFHSAAHTGDSALMQSARQASLDLCRDIPEPVIPGQPAS